MSLYGNHLTIDGVTCGLVLRGSGNGRYVAIFERELAPLENIKAIHWEQPVITGDCVLPAGYGFTVSDIRYSYGEDCYQVMLQVGAQYLGDVTGYQAQVSELQAQLQASEARQNASAGVESGGAEEAAGEGGADAGAASEG